MVVRCSSGASPDMEFCRFEPSTLTGTSTSAEAEAEADTELDADAEAEAEAESSKVDGMLWLMSWLSWAASCNSSALVMV